MVSIHAPREGCDLLVPQSRASPRMFQFTHPVRGATAKKAYAIVDIDVSIHAPREGCDTPIAE